MPRIVSLISSATEIIHALGFGDQLVGRSHECDYPPTVQQLPVCTEPKFNVEGSSYQIDERVKAILQEAGSVYRVHADVLKQLQPDVIVTQAQCEVCAVSLNDVERALCDWLQSKPTVVSLQPDGLNDVWQDIGKVAEALQIPQQGQQLVRELQARMDVIAKLCQRLSAKPTVACIEWIDPLMAAGNWVPTLVEMAGGVNLFGTAGQHAPWMSWEQLRQADPDVIIAMPCGYDLAKTESEMNHLTQHPQWQELQAVQSGRVYVTDGNQYFNRPGPRLVESLEILAEILHPPEFGYGHRGIGWQTLIPK